MKDCWKEERLALLGSKYYSLGYLGKKYCGSHADFGRSIGLEESVRRDVALIQEWKFLPKMADVVGYVYETETGRVR